MKWCTFLITSTLSLVTMSKCAFEILLLSVCTMQPHHRGLRACSTYNCIHTTLVPSCTWVWKLPQPFCAATDLTCMHTIPSLLPPAHLLVISHMPVMPLPISHRRSQTDFCSEVTHALFEEPDRRLAPRAGMFDFIIAVPLQRSPLRRYEDLLFVLTIQLPSWNYCSSVMYWRRHLAIDPCWHLSCLWGSYGRLPYPVPGRSNKGANVYRKSRNQAGNVYGQENFSVTVEACQNNLCCYF